MSSIARTSSRINSHASNERRARAHSLIQRGALLNLSRLPEICDIQEGDDLQQDIPAYERSATLLGILLDAADRLSEQQDLQQMTRFRKRGTTFLKQLAAKTVYSKVSR